MTHPHDSSCADYISDISFEEFETFVARALPPLQVPTPETRGPAAGSTSQIIAAL